MTDSQPSTVRYNDLLEWLWNQFLIFGYFAYPVIYLGLLITGEVGQLQNYFAALIMLYFASILAYKRWCSRVAR